MTDRPAETYGDPLTQPFWQAARERRLLIQRCGDCGRHQFYPRPYCIRCGGTVEWVESRGVGTVYSQTEVHVEVPGFTPPYVVGVVELDEGPRLTTHLVGARVSIGERVSLDWRERADGFPPMYVFGPADSRG